MNLPTEVVSTVKSVQIDAINLIPRVGSYRYYDNRAYRLISGSAQTRLLETFLALKIPELLIVRGAMPANKICEELDLDLTRGWKFLHALSLIGLLDQKPYLPSPSPSAIDSETKSELKSSIPVTTTTATASPTLTLSDDATLFDLSADSKYFFFGTDGGFYFRDLIAYQKYVTEIPGVSFVEVLKGAKIPVMPVWPPQTDWAAQHLEKWMTVTAQGAIKTIIASKTMEGAERLLDVGGGDGSIAIQLVQQYPDLHATVFNLPASAFLAKQKIVEKNCSEKVDVIEGDFLKDELFVSTETKMKKKMMMMMMMGTKPLNEINEKHEKDAVESDSIADAKEEEEKKEKEEMEEQTMLYDRIMFSRVLTDWTPKVCAMLFQKVRRALAPNGRLVINEAFFEGNEDYCLAWEYRYIFYDTFGRELFKPMEYYRKLLQEAGFKIVKISPMIDDAFYSVIEAEIAE